MDLLNQDALLYKAHHEIKIIFEQCQNNGENWETILKSYFDEEVPKLYNKLPWLNEANIDHLQPNQLVRFRGMVQDMYDPEFYMDTYVVKMADGTEIHRPGKYLDVTPTDGEEILVDSSDCKIKDRENYCCISIPGEAEWVKQIYISQNFNCPNEYEQSSFVHKKRTREDENEHLIEHSGENKRIKDNDARPRDSTPVNVSASKESKFPFPDETGVVCMLKIYDKTEELHLNDIIEVVGILCMDAPLPEVEGESVISERLETSVLPTSLAPRLHALSVTKRSHCNPYLPAVVEKSNLANRPSNLRELILPILRLALLGDEIAAEYLTCHLISSVFVRQDVVPIGKCSLNLSGITAELMNENYPKLLYGLLQSMTTHNHFLPMSLDNMNKLKFIPKKDYQENCLKSGILQLPSHFHLLMDETQLSAGQLDVGGVKNLTALSTLVNWQKVDYDFQFHSIEQHTDIQVLILSEGKSMISCDFQVRLEPQHTNVALAFSELSSMLSPQLLEQLRIHLSLARLMPHNLSESMQKVVQDDFVSSRQHSEGLSAESLHSLLTLARLSAQSCGKMELSEDIWKRAKMLETQRKGRLRNN